MRRAAANIVSAAIITGIALTFARRADAQSCATVPACPTRTTTCSRTISCGALNSITFNADETVCVSGGSCTITVVTINQPNVLLRGTSVVTVSPAASATDAFKITADGVGLENFGLSANGTVRFNDGITIGDGADHVSIRNVTVNGSTDNAGFNIPSSSIGTCLENTVAADAGSRSPPIRTSNGYLIRASGSGGSADFRGAIAQTNTFDGFSVEGGAGLSLATFLKTVSEDNDGDGYDLSGATGQVTLLCISSRHNGVGLSGQGRGIYAPNAQSVVVENAHVVDNTKNGIHVGSGTLRVIASTFVSNDTTDGQQIYGSNVSVYDTMAVGPVFVANAPAPQCSNNLYTGSSGGCAGTHDNPVFEDPSARSYLTSTSPGTDAGVDPTMFGALVANSQDHDGKCRPADGGSGRGTIQDIGAFERNGGNPPCGPTSTPTRTRTPTQIPSITPSPVPTVTRTPTPTRTRTPSGSCCSEHSEPGCNEPACNGCVTGIRGSCGTDSWTVQCVNVADTNCRASCSCVCTGDCNLDGVVTVNEILLMVNNALAGTLGCVPGDHSGDGKITVNEIIAAVNKALNGCSAGAGGGGGAGGGTAQIQIWPIAGYRGSNQVIPIVVSSANNQGAGLNVDLVYPTNVITAPQCVIDPAVPDNHALYYSDVAAGRRRLLLVDTSAYPSPAFPDGTVLSCTVTILSNAPYGTYDLPGDSGTLSDGWGNEIPSVVGTGRITVQQPGGGGCSTTGPSNFGGQLALLALLWLRMWVGRRFRSLQVRRGVTIAVLLALTLVAGTAFAQTRGAAGGTWGQLEGGAVQRVAKRGVQRSWHIRDLQISGRTVSGQLALVGASFFRLGTFEATVVAGSKGNQLAGTIRDSKGNEVATLTGTVTATGLQGEIVAKTGEVGEWSWETPEPGRLRAMFELLSTR
jgi:hypothetical protein